MIFDACETKSCVNVNDLEPEPDESFYYTLEIAPGRHDPRIELDPTHGEIEIMDDDG